MNSTVYTPEVMTQTGQIYDKLEQLTPDKRSIVTAVMEAFMIIC